MTIKKIGDKYKLDIRPHGTKGKRVIKLFDTKAKAVQCRNQLLSGRLEIQGVQPSIDNRRLPELIELWFNLHGIGLKSAKDRKARLLKLSNHLNDPVARMLMPEQFTNYRNMRIDAGITATTLNHELSFLKALFSELKRLDAINYDSLIVQVKKLKERKTELSYLTNEQITNLLHHVQNSQNESLVYVVKICLVTGARWSEAEKLTVQNCINQGFQFVDTKNGKNRFIPVEKTIFDEIYSRLQKSDFKLCYWAFRVAFARSQLTIARGQLSHVLRHSFASHFLMNGGNVVALQKILGHSSLNVTMRYSHLSPDYLNQAVQFNPLAVKE